MTKRFIRTISCIDTLGRTSTTDVSLTDDGRHVTILPPSPAGAYDSLHLDDLIAALQAARALMLRGRQ
jgi:hypothetical protein